MIRKISITIAFFLVFSLSLSAENSQTLVIVTNSNSELTPLNAKELRRLYLGLKVVKDNAHVKAIQNYSDDILHEVFLQKIMYMSSRTYQRQLKVITIRKGIKPPKEFSSNKSIENSLKNDNNSIAYMWKAHADANPNLHILQSF